MLLCGWPSGKGERRLFPHHGRHLFCGNAFFRGTRPRYGQHFLLALEDEHSRRRGESRRWISFLFVAACQQNRSVARTEKGKRKPIVRLGDRLAYSVRCEKGEQPGNGERSSRLAKSTRYSRVYEIFTIGTRNFYWITNKLQLAERSPRSPSAPAIKSRIKAGTRAHRQPASGTSANRAPEAHLCESRWKYD